MFIEKYLCLLNVILIMAKATKEDYAHSDSGVSGQYKTWFLDYASYVILERAVPAVEDGLKPVQRRILHAMKEMDDGRFNKVANIIGQSMQYHPHGDASIGAVSYTHLTLPTKRIV